MLFTKVLLSKLPHSLSRGRKGPRVPPRTHLPPCPPSPTYPWAMARFANMKLDLWSMWENTLAMALVLEIMQTARCIGGGEIRADGRTPPKRRATVMAVDIGATYRHIRSWSAIFENISTFNAFVSPRARSSTGWLILNWWEPTA